MHRFSLLLAAAWVWVSGAAFAAMGPAHLDGTSVDGKAVHVEAQPRHPMVAVFVSAKCPCSNSHLQELKALARDFPDARFVGVHANADEKDVALGYFRDAALPFPVLEDSDGQWANRFKALKTPHAFVVNEKGEILFRGGVSDSHTFANSKRRFLREALADLKDGKPVRTVEARTLGCVISRGETNVW